MDNLLNHAYHFFATGGTIDSEWVAEHDTAETRSQSRYKII